MNDLAAALDLTDNAVRAHLANLERDGLVRQAGTQPGFRKPHVTYALTPESEQIFPKAYGPLLDLILRVLSKKLSEKELRAAMRDVGKMVAANHLLGNIFSKEDLVRFAMNGEKVASGVKHADNLAPCIFGGVTLIRAILPLDIIPLSAPPLHVTVVHPQIEVKTSDARQILRKEVQLKNAIMQWGNIAGLVTGFLKNDYALIGRSLEDVIIEPVRSILIPGFDEVKINSKEAGALGGGISGSGPSIFMLSQEEKTAREVEKIMKTAFQNIGVEYKTYVTSINYEGVKVVSRES